MKKKKTGTGMIDITGLKPGDIITDPDGQKVQFISVSEDGCVRSFRAVGTDAEVRANLIKLYDTVNRIAARCKRDGIPLPDDLFYESEEEAAKELKPI